VEARALGRASTFACLCVAGLAALAGGACESKGDVKRAQLLTASDLQALLKQDPPPETILDGYGLPGGMRLDRIITGDATSAALVERDTFTGYSLGGYRSGYLTTEVWAGFDEVWIQPVYVAVEEYKDGAPPTKVKFTHAEGPDRWRPIFSVGPDSAFYSSYWRTIYFQIPPGQDKDSFRSVKDVLDRGCNFREGEAHVMALAPKDLGTPTPVFPPAGGKKEVGKVGRGDGLYDGEEVHFLDFGTDTFTWDAKLVVEEAPLFVWVVRGQDGELHALDMPTVAGSGPLYSGREPLVVDGKPRYGSYWRIYTVELQPEWRVFIPPSPAFQDQRDRLAGTPYLYSMGVPYADALKNLPDDDALGHDEFVGRVLTNPACVSNTDNLFPENATSPALAATICVYADTQKKIEELVPSAAIHKTDIVVTCPFITYDEKALELP
jgi:hypothetical protein